MIHRGVFLGEGSSDAGIAVHIERIATECGVEIQLTTPDADLLPTADKTIAGKLRALMRLGASIMSFSFIVTLTEPAERPAYLKFRMR